ncbi:MAG: zinc ribbon domain-containing protein [Chloroflexales bacterium]|nr:zinc ribbon domain-containing protein [Chloroflexales bacterium]
MNPPGSRFCNACGSPLGLTRPLGDRATSAPPEAVIVPAPPRQQAAVGPPAPPAAPDAELAPGTTIDLGGRYTVERSTAPAGPWTTLSTLQLGTELYDSALVLNTTYYYRIIAVDWNGTASAPLDTSIIEITVSTRPTRRQRSSHTPNTRIKAGSSTIKLFGEVGMPIAMARGSSGNLRMQPGDAEFAAGRRKYRYFRRLCCVRLGS